MSSHAFFIFIRAINYLCCHITECFPLNFQVFINFAKDQADPDGTDAGPDVTLDSSDTSSQASTISSIY